MNLSDLDEKIDWQFELPIKYLLLPVQFRWAVQQYKVVEGAVEIVAVRVR